jgi:hypothetical protein
VSPEPDDDLRFVAFLRADAPVTDPMPPEVWDRLRAALDSEQAVVPLQRRRLPGRRAIGGLIAASVALLAGVLFIGRTETPDVVATAPADSPAKQIVASGVNYTPGQFKGQIKSVLQSMGIQRAEQMAEMPPSPQAMRDPAMSSLAACIRGLARAEGFQALMVDRATYDGVEAAVIVLGIHLDVNNNPMLDVFVVRSDCTEDSQRVLAHVVASLD